MCGDSEDRTLELPEGVKLKGQLARVFDVMRDQSYRTPEEIAQETGDPILSVTARLRDLRKPQYGGFIVERFLYSTNGNKRTFEYRLSN